MINFLMEWILSDSLLGRNVGGKIYIIPLKSITFVYMNKFEFTYTVMSIDFYRDWTMLCTFTDSQIKSTKELH